MRNKAIILLMGWLFIGAFLPNNLYTQSTIQGTVFSSDGEPLIGANVLLKNSDSGTSVEIDGSFSINASASDTLVVSFVGFQTQEIPVGNQTTFQIILLDDSEILDEIVVVGYGIQRKSDLTGSIASIKAEEISAISTGNVEQALQGKVAGVQVTPISGRPGEGAVVRIRGVGTLNDASPLYVVDGMLLDDISFLNVNDIESLEVLKDASATAIYGSRGANGVIIISTKKGEYGAETTFSVNVFYGTQSLEKKIKIANAREYALLANELSVNEGRSPLFDNPESFGEGTDWQNVIFQDAPMYSIQLSANGGSERSTFNISGNYFRQQGIIRNSDFERFTMRLNNTYKLGRNITFGHNLSFIFSKNQFEPGVLGSAYSADPTIPVLDSTGFFSNTTINAPVGNPEAEFFYKDDNTGTGYQLIGSAFGEYNFLKDFTYKMNFGADLKFDQSKNFVPVFLVSPIQQNQQSVISVADGRRINWLWENTISYFKEIGVHRIGALAGVTAQEFIFENLGGSRRNLIGDTEEFFYLQAGETGTETNFNSASEWSMYSYLFRVNYTLMDRYLFTGSFRRDGSSRFGSENRFGYFPSLALGWNLVNESFFTNQDIFSRLKLRASWGKIGNDKIGEYEGKPTVTSNLLAVFGTSEDIQNGASIVNLANPFIRWEETTQSNVGFEFGILDNRFTGEVDYYNRTTNDILVAVPIPKFIGADNDPVINAARVRNTGIDLKLDYRDSFNKFNYEIGGILSTVKNEVLELGEGKEEIFGGGLGVGGMLGTRTVPGMPIGAYYGFQIAGVFQTEEEIASSPNRGVEVPGDLQFIDVNQDGLIDSKDRTFIGSPIPDLMYGFNLALDYQGISLNVDFQGQAGNELVNAKKMARFGTSNFETTYLNRWNGVGTSNGEPRITNGGHNYEFSERFIENGAYLRLRNVQLGYTIPTSLTDKIGFQSAQLYVRGTNLKTWTDFTGYTPDISSNSVIAVGIDRGVYPVAKTISVGINATF